MAFNDINLDAIDLFCGAGGLSRGLEDIRNPDLQLSLLSALFRYIKPYLVYVLIHNLPL